MPRHCEQRNKWDLPGNVCRRNYAEQSRNDPFVQIVQTLHLPEGRKPELRRLGRPSKSNQQISKGKFNMSKGNPKTEKSGITQNGNGNGRKSGKFCKSTQASPTKLSIAVFA